VFRVKIAVLSLIISGAVLSGFGAYFLPVMNAVNLDRIDRELLALGGSRLHAPLPRG
jgi:hypothetical protein